jgi:hypothetical protein
MKTKKYTEPKITVTAAMKTEYDKNMSKLITQESAVSCEEKYTKRLLRFQPSTTTSKL